LFWTEVNLKHAIIGGKNYILAILRDITERKHIEERIKESEARYRVLFESCPDGILIADIETKRLQYANPAMSKMLGYKEEELKRMGVSDIHPKDKLEHVISEFGSQARGEKTLATDIPLLNKDRRVIYADVNSKPVLIDGKKHIIGFFRDITQRKRADDEIKNKTEQLKKLYELSKKIGSIISTDGLLPWIAENAAALLNIDTCSYRIKEGDYLIRCGGFGRGIEMMRKEKLKIGESLTGIVARDKKPLVVRNMQDDPRLINEHKNIAKRLGLVSFLGVPMMVEGEVRGVLCVSSKKYRRFTKSDIEFLSSFGEIAAIALENAKLFGEKTKWFSQFKAL